MESKKIAMETWSAKVMPETKQNLANIIENDFQSANQMLEVLIERYNNPKSIDKGNEELIKSLKKDVENLNNELLKMNEAYQSNRNELSEADKLLKETMTENQSLINQLEAFETDLTDMIVIPTDALKRSILEWIAQRETKRYKREISVETLVLFALDELLIKGNKYAFDSVPDSVIDKLKKEFQNAD